MYTIGGCNYYKKDKVKALNTCSRFNVNNQKFEQLAEMNVARINPSCFIYKNFLYAINGSIQKEDFRYEVT